LAKATRKTGWRRDTTRGYGRKGDCLAERSSELRHDAGANRRQTRFRRQLLGHVFGFVVRRGFVFVAARDRRQIAAEERLGELFVIGVTLSYAEDTQQWLVLMPTPRGAWDRDGALIAETSPEDEAQVIVMFFSNLTAWESIVTRYREENPTAETFAFNETERNGLASLSARLVEARKHTAALAYPDARDLPVDLDDYLAYRRERRRDASCAPAV
jgi:hypothetical protein